MTVAETIGDEYTSWGNERILLDFPTGQGKTNFCLTVLVPYVLKQGKKVLYLSNRNALREQVVERAAELNLPIDIYNYQRLETLLKNNAEPRKYDLIICDEIHYVLTDSRFNGYTDLSLNWVLNQTESCVVMMSATVSYLLKTSLKDKLTRIYKGSASYKNLKMRLFYRSNGLPIVQSLLTKTEDKILYFVGRSTDLLRAYEALGSNANYFCSESNKNICHLREECIHNNQFDNRVLVTTTALDNGVSLIDDSLKHIVLNVWDIETVIQCIGRKRRREGDELTVYIRVLHKNSVQYYLGVKVDQLNLMDKFQGESLEFHNIIKKSRDVIYGTYPDYVTNTIKLNECIWHKTQQEVEFYLDIINTTYESALSPYLLDIQDVAYITPKYLSVQDKIESWLEINIGKKFFSDKEKEDVIKSINIARDKKQMRTSKTLNAYLEKMGLPYKIENRREFERSSPNRNKRYWVINKR